MRQLDRVRKGKVILFHGTRAKPDSLRKLGILAGGLDRPLDIDPSTQKYPINKERTLERVLTEFGLKKSEVPNWCYKGELQYEENEPIHIHFCLNFDSATGYADIGGEPAYCIRKNILSWLSGIADEPYYKYRELHRSLSNKAKISNGKKSYVIVVERNLNDPRLENEFRESVKQWLEVIDKGTLTEDEVEQHCFQRSSYEVRYFGDIKPEEILGVVQINPEDFP
jgi:hypothetical protein